MDAVNEFITKIRNGEAPGLVDDLRKLKVTVIAGAHAGTEVRLPHGEIRFGSAPDNDVILFADDLQPHHCTVRVGANTFGKMRIEAIDGPVLVNHEKIVEPGELLQVSAGSTIHVGSAQVKIGPGVELATMKLPAIKIGVIAAMIAMLYVGSNLTSSVMSRSGGFGDKLLNTASDAVSSISGKGGLLSPMTAEDGNANLVGIRKKLQELGLSASVRVAALSADTMRVFGSVSPKHADAWNRFLRWYDDQADFPKLVRDVIRTASDPKLPKLQSVWLRDKPMAHFAGGVSAATGEELPGSWKVIEITAEAVTIERDGSPVRLKF